MATTETDASANDLDGDDDVDDDGAQEREATGKYNKNSILAWDFF